MKPLPLKKSYRGTRKCCREAIAQDHGERAGLYNQKRASNIVHVCDKHEKEVQHFGHHADGESERPAWFAFVKEETIQKGGIEAHGDSRYAAGNARKHAASP